MIDSKNINADYFKNLRDVFYNALTNDSPIINTMSDISNQLLITIHTSISPYGPFEVILCGGHAHEINSIYSDLDIIFLYNKKYIHYWNELRVLTSLSKATNLPKTMIHNFLFETHPMLRSKFNESFTKFSSGPLLDLRYLGYAVKYKIRDLFVSRSPQAFSLYLSKHYLKYDHFLLYHNTIKSKGYYKSIKATIVAQYLSTSHSDQIKHKTYVLNKILDRCQPPCIDRVKIYKDYVTILKLYKLGLYAYGILSFPTNIESNILRSMSISSVTDYKAKQLFQQVERLLKIRICLDTALFDHGISHHKIKTTKITDTHVVLMKKLYPNFFENINANTQGFKNYLTLEIINFNNILKDFINNKMELLHE